jgi:BlaI family penicillinase repressor
MTENAERKRPTDFELSVLQVLWAKGSATVREVHEELSKTRHAGYTTVLKIMQIMAEKGLVERVEQGRAHVYRPAESAEVSRNSLVGDLIDRAFAGSASQLVMHALSAKPSSSEELAEIRKLLDELEAKDE